MKLGLFQTTPETRGILEAWNVECVDDLNSAGLDAVLAAEAPPFPVPAPVLMLDAPLPATLRELELWIDRASKRRQQEIQLVHDLRSPLNAISGYAELIAETATGDEKRFAEKIRLAAIQMTERIQKLRDFGV